MLCASGVVGALSPVPGVKTAALQGAGARDGGRRAAADRPAEDLTCCVAGALAVPGATAEVVVAGAAAAAASSATAAASLSPAVTALATLLALGHGRTATG